jgi:hypothetical protein
LFIPTFFQKSDQGGSVDTFLIIEFIVSLALVAGTDE